MPEIAQLYTYPLKSGAPIEHLSIHIAPLGLESDRNWAIVDENNQCLTARKYPQLLHLTSKIEKNNFILEYRNHEIFNFNINDCVQYTSEPFRIFSYLANGWIIQIPEVNQWLTKFTGTSSRLMQVNENLLRPVLEKHNGKAGDYLRFADQAPILICSDESLNELNDTSLSPITMSRFRPNIVVSKSKPWEEDDWKRIRIGDQVILRIIQQCERCIMTTIDPITLRKDPQGEPLKTLAKYRRNDRNNTVFGMHAVVEKPGTINTGDQISILE